MLLTKEVKITIGAKNVNGLREKGYEIPTCFNEKTQHIIIDFGKTILVKIEDVSPFSHQKITYQCDNCGCIVETTIICWNRRKYRELGDMCKKCARMIKWPYAMQEKYGETNCARVPSVIEKKKETNKNRYGNEWAIASAVVQENIRAACIEKFGVPNCMQSESVKQKMFATNIEKYGNISVFGNEKIKEKARATCMRKYGVPNAFQVKEFQEKARATMSKNGTTPSSKPERALCDLLKEMFGKDNCFPNYPDGVLSLDCFLKIGDIKIDVEYDGKYWHQNRGKEDAARNAVLMNNGYRIIRIKGNNRDILPTKEQIQKAVDYLVKDNHHLVFIDMNKKNI